MGVVLAAGRRRNRSRRLEGAGEVSRPVSAGTGVSSNILEKPMNLRKESSHRDALESSGRRSATSRLAKVVLNEEMLRDLDMRTDCHDKAQKTFKLEKWMARAYVPEFPDSEGSEEDPITPRQLHIESMSHLRHLQEMTRY